jgi:hypothetical protein
MTTLLFISAALFVAYIITMCAMFGVPPSISDTYYLLEALPVSHRRRRCESIGDFYRTIGNNYGLIFILWCWYIAITLLTYWLENSGGNSQFLTFLSAAGLFFVGGAAHFRASKIAKAVHTWGAITCAGMALLWLCIAGLWIWPCVLLIIGSIIAVLDRRNWLFWLEVAGFLSIYVTLLTN